MAATDNKSIDEVLAEGCTTTPPNFGFSDFWNQKMGVLAAACQHPEIAFFDINGRRKPQAFIYGSANVSHDLAASKTVNGTGANDDTLGVAPRTTINFGAYCTNTRPLQSARDGDAIFSLRGWNPSNLCDFLDASLPTIPIWSIDNQYKNIASDRNHPGILLSSGANYILNGAAYSRTIDYFSPGGGPTAVGGGNISYALAEFSGIVTALNAALVANNRAILTNSTIKAVLDASSDEVFLEVNGARGIYKESQIAGLSGYKYFGQIVNLSEAINFALASMPRLSLLTLINKVTNDNGGDASVADFDLYVKGGNYHANTAHASGEWLEIEQNVSYTLSEDPLPGYAQTGIVCKNDDTEEMIPHPVRLNSGESATCTISNNDIAPKITLLTEVRNENDGTLGEQDFILRLNGQGHNGSIPAYYGEPITAYSNTIYRISKDPVPGYTQTGIDCQDTGAVPPAPEPYPIVLSEGQSVTCTLSFIDRVDSTMFIIPTRNGKMAVIEL